MVAELATRRMLPAVWFIFSRRDCDAAAVLLAERGLALTSEQERAAIEAEVKVLGAEQPEAIKAPLLPALLAGAGEHRVQFFLQRRMCRLACWLPNPSPTATAAAHHAGCLPAWKGLVERLFQRGLLKVGRLCVG